MPFGLAAAGAGSVIGGIGSAIGGGKQASATRQAAQDQMQSAAGAQAIQQNEFNTVKQDESPYVNAGDSAISQLMGELPSLTAGFNPAKMGVSQNFSFSPESVSQDPGYQFALQQGTQAIQRSAAANGEVMGGATMKSLDNYATGEASQYENQDYNQAFNTHQQNYNNAFNEFDTNQQNTFNRLSSVAGLGVNANSGVNAAGQNMANNNANIQQGIGNSQAAGVMGVANAQNAGLAGVSSNMGSMLNSPSFQTALSNYMNQGAQLQTQGSYLDSSFGNSISNGFDNNYGSNLG